MTAAGETSADPLHALKDEWHPKGYCLGATTEGLLVAFFIADEKPAENLVAAGTPEELGERLEADRRRRRLP